MTTPTDAIVPVLFASHEPEFGGAERSLAELIAHLDRSRFAPHLACSHAGPLTETAAANGARVHVVPMKFAGKLAKVRGLLRAADRLATIIDREAIGLVHANTLLAGYAVTRAARRAAIPSVWHVRDIGYPWLARRAVRNASWAIANSEATAASLDADRVSVIYNGVDESFFEPGERRSALRTELGLPSDAQLVAMVGRLDPWKGHRMFLRAAAASRFKFPNTHYVILGGAPFGDGSYADELRSHAGTVGLDDQVHFVGARDDVAAVLGACDILVHPSTRPEPFGRAIAEAMAAGIAVIGADHGGIPELISHERDGLLFAPNSVNALRIAMQRLMADHALRARLGAAGRATAGQRFTAERHAAAVGRLFDSLLEREAAPPPAPRSARVLQPS